MQKTVAKINLDGLRRNAQTFMDLAGVPLIAVVKANAYGHGAAECARVFRELGAAYFGVAIPEEGVQLREAGYDEPILVFGYTFSDSYELLFHYDLMPNVFTLAQAEELSAMAAARPAACPMAIQQVITRTEPIT